MEIRASARYVRFSPQKVRQVTTNIIGLPVNNALSTLRFTQRASARVVSKVLESAVANAEHNVSLREDQLRVKRAVVEEGPTLKRMRPRARGRADVRRRRTCHITVILESKE